MKTNPVVVACALLIVVLICTSPMPSRCAETSIPEALADWRDWVLHGKEQLRCPTPYNNASDFRCQWPARLQLSIDADGGRFEQSWLMFAEGWVALPGGPSWWPQGVTVDGAPAAVMDRNRTPSTALSAGQHRVAGEFSWKKIPEMIVIPPTVGMVSLVINGKKIESPAFDDQGRLWLQKRSDAGASEDRLSVRLFRLLTDTIPMQVTTRIRLHVSGEPREMRLPKILLENSVPMGLDSPLPAKLAPDGSVICQLRPGQWDLTLTTRLAGPAAHVACSGQYGPEIWSFQSQNHLRMVETTGAPSVEPERTDMPPDWKGWPAYSLAAGGHLEFKEIRRGDPDPAPDRLNLYRTWWLDFDGKGYTIHDAVTGTMSRQWYLAMNPPGELGRVALDGNDQLITRQGENQLPGVALRRGTLNMAADSRFNAPARRIPAVGWDHDFQQVSGELHLPPGWQLLATGGVDAISGTWIQRWSLLDFFLTLIIALSVAKLRSLAWGTVALITMILIYHEPGAPRLVFLNIVAALALVKLLPDGWFKKLVHLWGAGAMVVLLVLAIPFMVQQIRWGVFPQLAPRDFLARAPMGGIAMAPPAPQLAAPSQTAEPDTRDMEYARENKSRKSYRTTLPAKTPMPQQAMLAADPNALIQTGPGLPTWQWRSFTLAWNGPVDREQTVRLWLVSPAGSLVLAIGRTLLLAALILGLLDIRFWWQQVNEKIGRNAAVAALGLFLILPGGRPAAAAGYPPPELLKELETRLLEKPDCLPHCADVLRMGLTLEPDRLDIRLEIHAATRTAIPLPATRKSWTPAEVLLDQRPLAGLSRDRDGTLWALIPKGIHTLILTGSIRGDVIQIPLPLQPHRATHEGRGWRVRGIHPDGSVDASIEITRTGPATSGKDGTPAQTMPAFFSVRRVLHLGLTWQVSTTINRLTPPGTPVMLALPLLGNESVTTPGIHVKGTHAQIAIAPQVRRFQFESSLETARRIELTAPESVPWTETWVLDASPVWHCEMSGIPVIHHQDKRGHWQPEWSPWPGESVGIAVSRPEAIAGQMITMDSAHLDWTPGQRFSKAGLSLRIRTSRGGQHTLGLPEQADLQVVTINGKSLPIRQTGGTLSVPLQPGSQEVHVAWHQPAATRNVVRAPRVTVGGAAVNAHISFHMPANRWILLAGGPRLGPAVLFWSYLAIVVLAAWGLKKIGLAPLAYYQWLLLGLGLTQVSPLTALLVVAWLPALGLRGKKPPPERWLAFNATQLVLVLWTIAALSGLYEAVERGLLGIPDMQIAGNESTRHQLNWTQDRIESAMPRPWALTVPLWSYRLVMLLWSLWLAFFLLKWLQWGWRCFSTNGLWKKATFRKFRREKKKPRAETGDTPAGG